MRIHSIRKFFFLTVLYIAGLFAILLLQFRNESAVIRTLGSLRVTLSQISDKNQEATLKNSLSVAFPGITFTQDDATPAYLLKSDGNKEALKLQKFEETGDTSCTFHFENGASVSFAGAGSGEDSRLEISAELPEDATAIILNYASASGYSVSSPSEKQLVFTSAKDSFSLKASAITEKTFSLGEKEIALFSPYDPTSVFTFESALSSSLSEKSAFEGAVRSLREKVVQAFQNADAQQISEEAVMAYVAEMAQNSRYQEALDAVPTAFKRSSRRTFRTTPYFGNLVEMNRTLSMQLNNDKTLVSQALSARKLDIFENWDIVTYLVIMSGTENIHRLLAIPSEQETFEPSIKQAAGILHLYSVFSEKNTSCAALLESVIGKCLETLESKMKISENNITINESEESFSPLEIAQIGSSLVSYGEVAGRADIAATGRVLIVSTIDNSAGTDLRFLSELYALLIKDNLFYPRAIILDNTTDPTLPIWVWTAANSVKAEIDDESILLRYEFPKLDSHYSLVSGIKSLKSIEIYGMQYRTDPRFESYNSSGYSYSADTKTLLLKTRHKEAEEKIRVTFEQK